MVNSIQLSMIGEIILPVNLYFIIRFRLAGFVTLMTNAFKRYSMMTTRLIFRYTKLAFKINIYNLWIIILFDLSPFVCK